MKYFLCFWVGDGADCYNVFYSELVLARNKDEALEKYFASGKAFAYNGGANTNHYEAIEKIVIE